MQLLARTIYGTQAYPWSYSQNRCSIRSFIIAFFVFCCWLANPSACYSLYSTNLVTNGDFEGFTLSPGPGPFYFNRSYSVWYEYSNLPYEVKSIQSPPTTATKACDLSSNRSSIVCQDVNLVINKIYELSFMTVFKFAANKLGRVGVYINGNLVLTTTSSNATQNTLIPNSTLVLSLSTLNQICFKELTPLNASALNGPVIDNVTVFEIVEDWTQLTNTLTWADLFVQFSVARTGSSLLLISNYSYFHAALSPIWANFTRVMVEDAEVFGSVFLNDTGMLAINVTIPAQYLVSPSDLRVYLLWPNQRVRILGTVTNIVGSVAGLSAGVRSLEFVYLAAGTNYVPPPNAANSTSNSSNGTTANATNNANSTVNTTANTTVNGTTNSTNNSTTNGTTNGASSTNVTVNGTTNNTAGNTTASSTTNATANGTMNSTNNITVNSTANNTAVNSSTTNNTTTNNTGAVSGVVNSSIWSNASATPNASASNGTVTPSNSSTNSSSNTSSLSANSSNATLRQTVYEQVTIEVAFDMEEVNRTVRFDASFYLGAEPTEYNRASFEQLGESTRQQIAGKFVAIFEESLPHKSAINRTAQTGGPLRMAVSPSSSINLWRFRKSIEASLSSDDSTERQSNRLLQSSGDLVYRLVVVFSERQASDHFLSPGYFILFDQADSAAYVETSKVYNAFVDIFGYFYPVLSSGFCSYFVVKLVTFWNLTFLYIYLPLRLVPEFCREMLHQVSALYFQDMNFIEFFNFLSTGQRRQFPLYLSQTETLLASPTSQIGALVDELKVSVDFVNNNLDEVSLLGLLVLKLALLYFLTRRCCRSLNLTLTKLVYILAVEILVGLPFFVLSASCKLMSMGALAISGKASVWLHVGFVFALFSLITANYINRRARSDRVPKAPVFSSRSLKSVLSLNNELNQGQLAAYEKRVFKNRCKRVSTNYAMLQFGFCVMEPALLVFGNSLPFFLLMTPLTLAQFCFVLWNRKWHTKWELFNRLTMSLVWIAFNLVWLCFFALEKQKVDELLANGSRDYDSGLKVGGFLILALVLLGGLVEIVCLVVDVFETGIKCFCYLLKMCFKKVRRECQSETERINVEFVESAPMTKRSEQRVAKQCSRNGQFLNNKSQPEVKSGINGESSQSSKIMITQNNNSSNHSHRNNASRAEELEEKEMTIVALSTPKHSPKDLRSSQGTQKEKESAKERQVFDELREMEVLTPKSKASSEPSQKKNQTKSIKSIKKESAFSGVVSMKSIKSAKTIKFEVKFSEERPRQEQSEEIEYIPATPARNIFNAD